MGFGGVAAAYGAALHDRTRRDARDAIARDAAAAAARRVNVSLGPKEDRMLITGLHTVRGCRGISLVSHARLMPARRSRTCVCACR
jgi:hypothetical protein